MGIVFLGAVVLFGCTFFAKRERYVLLKNFGLF